MSLRSARRFRAPGARQSVRSVPRRQIAAATTAVVVAGALLGPIWTSGASAATLSVKINFQPPAAAIPAGYVADSGQPYSADTGRGWVRQDSLASATHVPLDLYSTGSKTGGSYGNTRDRNRSGIPQQLDTLIHMQYGDIKPAGTSGNLTPGAFEYAVPVGTYQVTVSVGDMPDGATSTCAAPCYRSVHTINVEGVRAIDRFVQSASAEYKQATVTVPVTDGRLTIDALGGTNTKLDYVTIDQVASTTSPTPTVTPTPTPTTPTPTPTPTPTTPTPTPTATGAFALKVNFQNATTTPPAGYVRDFGEAYGARTGTSQGTGLTYGWVNVGTTAPLNLVGNGRNRNTDGSAANLADVRLATFMHMQLPAGSSGVATPGSWEVAVPNGTYAVTVSAGDFKDLNSSNWINIEDQNAVTFTPSTSTKFLAATRTVVVKDKRLTLSPSGGKNTKIDYADIQQVTTTGRPYVSSGHPVNVATGVYTSSSFVGDLNLPNSGVDETSLSSATVTLTEALTGAAVPARVATSGGGDTINVSADAELKAKTTYRVTVTDGVKDLSGAAFLPFSSVFTTGAGPQGIPGVAFDQVPTGATGQNFGSITKGPDGKIYASTLDGYIYRWDVAADGTFRNEQVITTVRDHAVAQGLYGAPNRTVLGLAFDPASTAANLVLWITDNSMFAGSYDIPDFTSGLAKLTGPNLETYTDVLVNLPRSVKDHEVNSIAFGPDGAMYFAVGAMSAMGAPDSTWQGRLEHLLSAAILRLDPAKLPATLPIDVKTADVGGTYDPYAPGAPLTIYATGVRNAFDLVWHSNGHLYAPTNGSAAYGSAPRTPATLPASCTPRHSDGQPYTGPSVPAIVNNPQPETDWLYDVHPNKYYGHPNPTRCEWVLDNGNPTSALDPFEMDAYPVGTQPDRNYALSDIFDIGLHASADGAIEYHGNAFGGALDHKLLIVRYSDGQDIVAIDANATTGKMSNMIAGITGFTGFSAPLDIAQDPATGFLYVSELGRNSITLLRPHL